MYLIEERRSAETAGHDSFDFPCCDAAVTVIRRYNPGLSRIVAVPGFAITGTLSYSFGPTAFL